MYFGRVVETGDAREMFRNPRHPYTALLMRSAPVPGQRHIDPEAGLAELPDRPAQGLRLRLALPARDRPLPR